MRKLQMVLLCALVVQPAVAGVVFHVETKEGQETREGRMAVQDRRLRIDDVNSDDGEISLVFHGERREVLIIDRGRNRCMVMDEASMAAVGESVDAVAKQMEAALAQVPEAQREMVRKMMEQRMPPGGDAGEEAASVEVRRSGESREVSGYPAVRYEVLEAGRVVREVWVTDWRRLPGAAEVRAVMEEMAGFYDDLFGELRQTLARFGGAMADLEHHPLSKIDEMGGFPVWSRELGDGGGREMRLRSVVEETLADAEFEPPKGCRVERLQDALQGMPR